ncbi:tail tube protein [uncultured Caudovirales phage]|uniref:Tail tube protein n=1 Tax=uncultured Caudovirales phage TaxID=2100421 RepID=A0A6J5KWB9_9CAUD|nr:tail tube protein [uncultured Caudovirales phage]
MTFISNFVAEAAGGMALTNRFIVAIPTPPKFALPESSGGNSSLRKLLLFCEATQLPSLHLTTNPVRTYGEVREMPYELMYDTITLSFYVDASMYVKKFFDNWIQGVQLGATRNLRYYDEYTTDLWIFVQDKEENTRYGVQLYEAYPKNVSQVDLSYASHDVMKLSVTFQYKYWASTMIEANASESMQDMQSDPANDLGKIQDYISADRFNSYTSNFTQFQQEVNRTLGNIIPERKSIYTGTTPADF